VHTAGLGRKQCGAGLKFAGGSGQKNSTRAGLLIDSHACFLQHRISYIDDS